MLASRRLGLASLLLPLFLALGSAAPLERAERVALREEVRELFHHGYDNYMEHAFPADVLLPLSCRGRDGWGGITLTLIDTLDTLALFGNASEFEARVHWVAEHVSFDVDETVSLFETTIRALGGLLSAHLLALDPEVSQISRYPAPGLSYPTHSASLTLLRYPPQLHLMASGRPYDARGGLLALALDLATRLLPALDTPSGIPYGSVNLRHGVMPTESTITCTAAGKRVLYRREAKRIQLCGMVAESAVSCTAAGTRVI